MVAIASPAAAQGIAGTVRDTTGAVLPGVTVEAASPALIEKARTAVTDANGQYRFVDLRPGVYTVTFTLVGFATVRRDGITLETNFVAPVSVEMRVGGIEETITVSGASPVVDVQTTARRDVLAREVLDALPTGRNFQTIGQIIPALSSGPGRFDVGGSTVQWQSQLTAHGGQTADTSYTIDGMRAITKIGSGLHSSYYHNDGAYQEMVYQYGGATAEVQTPGVSIGMIPKQGGNQFRAELLSVFSNGSLQSSNDSSELLALGLPSRSVQLQKQYDLNPGVGGPIVKDRLWFFASFLFRRFDNDVPIITGARGIDDNWQENYTTHITAQVSQKNRISGMYEKERKDRGHRNIDTGLYSPEATVQFQFPNVQFAMAKWTSTITNSLLFDAGIITMPFDYVRAYRPEVRRATCDVAFSACPAGTDYGDIAHIEVTNNYTTIASADNLRQKVPGTNITAGLSYVTGAHNLKGGLHYNWGYSEITVDENGGINQLYRNGAPVQVRIKNSPAYSRSDLDREIGLYLQDSWTLNRLTVSPGIRWDWIVQSIPAQCAPAGRFVPERCFSAVENIPNWKNWAPRLGVAYDLFGDGKLAVKGSIGKYTQQDQVQFSSNYIPTGASAAGAAFDTRNWTDLNRDDIAQENEIGPGNPNFAVRRERNPAPDIKRPYQTIWNLQVNREIVSGAALNFAYNGRKYFDEIFTLNLAAPPSEYTLVTIPDPRGSGTLPIYNINPAVFGLVNELDLTSPNNTRRYHGFDVGVSVRTREATFMVGSSTGRTEAIACDVGDPNALRFCDQTEFDVPWRTTFKASGTYQLPYRFRLGAVFQTVAGAERSILYRVDRTVMPSLVQTFVNVRLNEPGSLYDERVNQLDFNINRLFTYGRLRLTPQFELFNLFNANPVTSQVNTWGTTLGRPLTILGPRLIRLGLKMDF
jgi:hypothetical protein